MKNNLKDYANFFNISLRNLLEFKDNEEVYKILYYNRTRDIEKIKSILRHIQNRGDNILITGPAGCGKTNFLYRIFFEKEFMRDNNLYPIIVDYGLSYSYENTLLDFVNQMKSFFEKENYPINNLKENSINNISENIHLIKIHLKNYYNNKTVAKYLLILLDDLDYMDDKLYQLLEQFYSIAICKHASVILSARPKLYLSIYNYDDRFSIFFTRNVERIKLKPLSVEKIIAKRIAYVLNHKSESNKSFIQYIKSIFEKKDIYLRMLEKMGVTNIDELEKIPLPFSSHLTNFMSVITNNNIREILDISYDLLVYILDHYDELEDIEEEKDGILIKRKFIPEERIFELFSNENILDNDDESEEDYYKHNFSIINIHKVINKKGNSLYFNTLEAIRTFEVIDQRIYHFLEKLGHTKIEVNKAIQLLSNKAHRLIVEKRYVPKEYKTSEELLHKEYQLTEKGDYYLSNIAYWPSYVAKYGQTKESLKDII